MSAPLVPPAPASPTSSSRTTRQTYSVSCSSALSLPGYDGSDSFVGKGYYICLLNDLESGLAIICACAPGLKAYTSLFNGSSKPSASYASGKGRPDASSGVSAPAKPGLAASPSSPGLRDDRSERLMVELGDLKFDFEQSSTTKEWSPV